ncbi:unnamed protein product [Miscanthus lutarioriparius]|uniref:glutathione transferase n=1 Tax=Miscanthus lutarioriparius TaxID=422564 RepID=A0A811RS74_9POAL|nr:unnamed protein product [Miscanthus lutarioriparius]
MATSAVKVYGWAISPFVSRALLALEEAGVDYELVPMSRQAGDHHRPEHLARNPFGKVPVLEDGDLTLFGADLNLKISCDRETCSPQAQAELLGTATWSKAALVDVWFEVEAHQLSPLAIAIVVECIFTPFLGR